MANFHDRANDLGWHAVDGKLKALDGIGRPADVEIDALTLGGTAITATGAELNILDGVTATAAELNKLDGVTATTAEINNAADVSARVQEITASGAVTAGKQSIELNHATVAIAATIADLANHEGLLVLKNTSASGTEAHTVTLTAGTFNGTNTIATLDAPGEALVVYVDSGGNGVVIANVGAVGLSGP